MSDRTPSGDRLVVHVHDAMVSETQILERAKSALTNVNVLPKWKNLIRTKLQAYPGRISLIHILDLVHIAETPELNKKRSSKDTDHTFRIVDRLVVHVHDGVNRPDSPEQIGILREYKRGNISAKKCISELVKTGLRAAAAEYAVNKVLEDMYKRGARIGDRLVVHVHDVETSLFMVQVFMSTGGKWVADYDVRAKDEGAAIRAAKQKYPQAKAFFAKNIQ